VSDSVLSFLGTQYVLTKCVKQYSLQFIIQTHNIEIHIEKGSNIFQ
jgi:hypothetical protein